MNTEYTITHAVHALLGTYNKIATYYKRNKTWTEPPMPDSTSDKNLCLYIIKLLVLNILLGPMRFPSGIQENFLQMTSSLHQQLDHS